VEALKGGEDTGISQGVPVKPGSIDGCGFVYSEEQTGFERI